MRGKSLMIQGTGSSVGKSVICAALLRIMKQDGFDVAPFKAQNMALNSFATREGLEMGRAQVTQAQAAGIEPSVRMNPVLLKPTSDRRSQVIVNGRPLGNMTALEYHAYKPRLRRMIKQTYDELEREHDFIVLEGAGSPAEINLREGDIVNMSMAEAADAPVILVGDINLGGVFASLLGTMMLLTDRERARVKGVIINKFRGDVKILEPGLRMLEERIGVPVLGVVPWMDVELEDEDSVTERLERVSGSGDMDVAVVKLRHMSNFSDFQALALAGGARVRYVGFPGELSGADVVILPGTKNTIEDLLELRASGMDDAIARHAQAGGLVIGICGGYQMLGKRLRDPEHVESRAPEAAGLGLIDMDVVFRADKTTVQAVGEVRAESGWLAGLNGTNIDGYEIHAGVNEFHAGCRPWLYVRGAVDGVTDAQGNVIGSYLHGLFDDGALWRAVRERVCAQRGVKASAGAPMSMDEYREREFDRIAAIVRASVDMERVYRIARGEE